HRPRRTPQILGGAMGGLADSQTRPFDPKSVFGSRPIFPRSGLRLPRFDDDNWDLSAIQPQRHLKAAKIPFSSIPGEFIREAKEFTQAQLREVPDDGSDPIAAETVVD